MAQRPKARKISPPETEESKGFLASLTANIGLMTALLISLGGLTDAGVAFFAKTPSVTCHFGLSLPWCPPPASRKKIEIPALDYMNGSGVTAAYGEVKEYGDVLMNASPYFDRPNSAEWKIYTPIGGDYLFDVQYATNDPRPVRVLLNGKIWRQSALNAVTGGFKLESQKFIGLGMIRLSTGDNVIRFESDHVFPHIRTLRFTPASQSE